MRCKVNPEKKTKLLFIMCLLTIALAGCHSNYKEGMRCFNEGEYMVALDYFKMVSEDDRRYKESQEMIVEIEKIYEEKKLARWRRIFIHNQQQIFKELMELQDRAMKEANRRYPTDIYKEIEYQNELVEKYTMQFLAKYNLTQDSLTKILTKGVKEDWHRLIQ